MTEEALAAPAPAPVSAEALEAAPAKVVEPKTEQEDAGAAPKTADDGAGAAVTAAVPTTAPVQTQEAAAGDDAAEKGPPPADSVIAARLRELLEETDLEKTSGERERRRRIKVQMDHLSDRGTTTRTSKKKSKLFARAPLSVDALSPFVASELEETAQSP